MITGQVNDRGGLSPEGLQDRLVTEQVDNRAG